MDRQGLGIAVHSLGDGRPLLFSILSSNWKAGEWGGLQTGDWREGVLSSDLGSRARRTGGQVEYKNGDAQQFDVWV